LRVESFASAAALFAAILAFWSASIALEGFHRGEAEDGAR
jgi:hypothetical protein